MNLFSSLTMTKLKAGPVLGLRGFRLLTNLQRLDLLHEFWTKTSETLYVFMKLYFVHAKIQATKTKSWKDIYVLDSAYILESMRSFKRKMHLPCSSFDRARAWRIRRWWADKTLPMSMRWYGDHRSPAAASRRNHKGGLKCQASGSNRRTKRGGHVGFKWYFVVVGTEATLFGDMYLTST
jgi:hypothetical protein